LLAIDPAVLAATIVLESGGQQDALRYEKHLDEYSIGLAQLLTSTAWTLGYHLKNKTMPKHYRCWNMPKHPVSRGGNLEEWKLYLRKPLINITLCAGLYNLNNGRFGLKNDPVLLYCSYNAGSIRPANNPWGLMHAYPALDGFLNHLGVVKSII
jgi:hypothetical protein